MHVIEIYSIGGRRGYIIRGWTPDAYVTPRASAKTTTSLFSPRTPATTDNDTEDDDDDDDDIFDGASR